MTLIELLIVFYVIGSGIYVGNWLGDLFGYAGWILGFPLGVAAAIGAYMLVLKAFFGFAPFVDDADTHSAGFEIDEAFADRLPVVLAEAGYVLQPLGCPAALRPYGFFEWRVEKGNATAFLNIMQGADPNIRFPIHASVTHRGRRLLRVITDHWSGRVDSDRLLFLEVFEFICKNLGEHGGPYIVPQELVGKSAF
jgi:hypothetical protein